MKAPTVKEKVLETATRLFYEQGYNLSGINQIVDESGTARGSLYYNFESKVDLLLAYLNHCSSLWFESVDEFISSKSSKDKVLGLFDFKAEFQNRFNFGGCPFIKIVNEVGNQHEKISTVIKEFKLSIKHYIYKLVKDAQFQNALSDEELSDMIFLFLEGGDVSSTIFRDNKQIISARNIIDKLI